MTVHPQRDPDRSHPVPTSWRPRRAFYARAFGHTLAAATHAALVVPPEHRNGSADRTRRSTDRRQAVSAP